MARERSASGRLESDKNKNFTHVPTAVREACAHRQVHRSQLYERSRNAKPVRFYDRFPRPVTSTPTCEPRAINTIVYLAWVHRFICVAWRKVDPAKKKRRGIGRKAAIYEGTV